MNDLIIILIGIALGSIAAFVYVDRLARINALKQMLAAEEKATEAAKALHKLHTDAVAALQNSQNRLESLEMIVKSSTNSPSLVKRF